MPVFPVVGYTGKVEPHWGVHPGGSDLFADRGTPVVAPVGASVLDVSSDGIGGNSVTLLTKDNLRIYMAHLDSVTVAAGRWIAEGTQVGTVGDTGNAKGTGPHLHIGVGRRIQSGSGAAGGSGLNFDAVTWLRNLQAGTAEVPAFGLPDVPADVGISPQLPQIPKIEVPGEDTLRTVASTIAQIPGAIVSPITRQVGDMFGFLQWLGQRNLFLRGGILLLGAVLLIIGLLLFALSFAPPETVRAAAKVLPV